MHYFALLALVPMVLAAPAPILKPRAGTVIPGKYIVVMKESATESHLQSLIDQLDGSPEHIYSFGSFKGVAASIEETLLTLLTDMEEVDYIEQDAVVQHTALTAESSAPLGLGRISHKAGGSTTYLYDTTAGSGTCSYIIDTGIYTAHPQFGGRATFLVNYAGDGSNADGNGHGTHVAGTVGSATYGVSKNTKLYAVKVLDSSGSGTTSGVIAGMNYAASDSKTRSGCAGKSVANMSLGGSYSASINAAAANAIKAGIFLAVAAGNDDEDAAYSSPSSEPTVCTVGAIDASTGKRASFSNYGTVVDIYGPGVDVLSTWNNGGTNTISGTSMATPHITGLAAYLLTLEGARTPAALCQRIKTLGITFSGSFTGTKLIAYNGNGA